MPNLRTDLQAVFVTASKNPTTQCWGCSTAFTYPTGAMTAVSPILVNAAPNHPTNIKLVPDQDPAKMSVQWQTKDAAAPQVAFGTSPDSLATVAAADTKTFVKNDIVTACTGSSNYPNSIASFVSVGKGWIDPNSLHKAVLTGLAPDTTYYYQIQDGAAGSTSPIYSFTTAPDPMSTGSFTMMFAADVGQGFLDGSMEARSLKALGAGGVSAAPQAQ